MPTFEVLDLKEGKYEIKGSVDTDRKTVEVEIDRDGEEVVRLEVDPLNFLANGVADSLPVSIATKLLTGISSKAGAWFAKATSSIGADFVSGSTGGKK